MASDGIQIGQGFVAKSTPALKSGDEPVPNERDESGEVIDIQMYVDYQCPFCQAFELTNGDYLDGLVENGGATVEIHPIAFLDNQSLGNEVLLARDERCRLRRELLPEPVLGLQPHPVREPAGRRHRGTHERRDHRVRRMQAGVEQPDEVAQCITDQSFKSWVSAATARAFAGPIPNSDVAQVKGTPTVIVNGQKYEGPIDDADAFAAFVVQVAGDSFSENSTPTPTPTAPAP